MSVDIHNRMVFPAGHVLAQEGEPVGSVYLLTKGHVSMSSLWRVDGSVVRIGPGTMIGDIAVILEHRDPKYRSTYTALEVIEVVRYSVDEILSHIDDMKHFEAMWLKSLARRVSLLTFDHLTRTKGEPAERIATMENRIHDLEDIIKNVDAYFLNLMKNRDE